MIFKQLILTNFKSHQHNIINFNSGVTLIIGENGAGKSTIFEAISYALYKKYTGDKIDDLIRTNQNTMTVALTFISNGTEYTITRKRTNQQSKATLQKQGTTIAEGDKTVNQHIQEILDMDSELFLNTTYIRQGEIANLISKSPAERKQLIAKLLKLEELEKTYKNILPLTNDYKWKQAEQKGKLQNNPSIKQDIIKHNELTLKYKQQKQNEQKLTQQQKTLQTQINTMEQLKKEYEQLNFNLTKEQENLERLQKEKTDLNNELKELKIIEQRIQELKPSVERLQICINVRDSFNKMNELQKQIDSLNRDLKKINDCETQIQTLQNDYNEYLNISDTLQDLEVKKIALQQDIQMLETLSREKEIIQQDIDDSKEQFNTINDLTDLDVSSRITEKDLDLCENQINNDIKSLESEWKENTEEIIKLKEQRSQLKAERDSCMKLYTQTAELDQQCPICKSTIDDNKKQELMEHYEKIINQNNNSITELNYKIDEITDISSKLASQIKNLKNIEKQLPQYRWLLNNIISNSSTIKNMEERLSDFDSKKNSFEKIEQKINLANTKTDILKPQHDEYIRLTSILTSLPKQEEINKQITDLEKQIDIEKDQIGDLESLYEDIDSHIEKLQKENQEYNQLLGSVKHKDTILIKIQKNSDEIIIKEKIINNLLEKIKLSLYDEVEYNNLKETEQEIGSNITETILLLKEYEIKLLELETNIQNSILSLEQNKEHQNNYDYLSSFIILLEDLRDFYSKDGVQKVLRSLSRPIIQNYTRKFFEEFNFNYSNLILDDEYNITLYGPEGEVKLDMISGGEKIAVALALRLGMTEAISKANVETILLDEPTIHLDVQRIHELITLLTGLSTLPQMIIVTHDIELENAADNLIRVVKENGISNVVGDQT